MQGQEEGQGPLVMALTLREAMESLPRCILICRRDGDGCDRLWAATDVEGAEFASLSWHPRAALAIEQFCGIRPVLSPRERSRASRLIGLHVVFRPGKPWVGEWWAEKGGWIRGEEELV